MNPFRRGFTPPAPRSRPPRLSTPSKRSRFPQGTTLGPREYVIPAKAGIQFPPCPESGPASNIGAGGEGRPPTSFPRRRESSPRLGPNLHQPKTRGWRLRPPTNVIPAKAGIQSPPWAESAGQVAEAAHQRHSREGGNPVPVLGRICTSLQHRGRWLRPPTNVIPAKAGIQSSPCPGSGLDPGLRRGDARYRRASTRFRRGPTDVPRKR